MTCDMRETDMKKKEQLKTYQEMYEILITECNFTEKLAIDLCDYLADNNYIEHKENETK